MIPPCLLGMRDEDMLYQSSTSYFKLTFLRHFPHLHAKKWLWDAIIIDHEFFPLVIHIFVHANWTDCIRTQSISFLARVWLVYQHSCFHVTSVCSLSCDKGIFFYSQAHLVSSIAKILLASKLRMNYIYDFIHFIMKILQKYFKSLVTDHSYMAETHLTRKFSSLFIIYISRVFFWLNPSTNVHCLHIDMPSVPCLDRNWQLPFFTKTWINLPYDDSKQTCFQHFGTPITVKEN